MIYRQWARGLAPGYRPTLADLWALAVGLGDPEPISIVNHPVQMHVFTIKR